MQMRSHAAKIFQHGVQLLLISGHYRWKYAFHRSNLLILSTLRTCGGSLEKGTVRNISIILFAVWRCVNQPDKQIIFALLCSLDNRASLSELGTTARAPLILLAAMHMPCAEPQTN